MAHEYLPPGKTHDCETKVRLTEPDHDLLLALARKLDVPPAVLARSLILSGLRQPGTDSIATPEALRSPAESRNA